jgi:phosphate-selective porin OprO and OprP
MNIIKRTISIITILVTLIPQAYADTAALEKRLEALEQEVAILKRQLEVEKEAKAQKAPETPIITASAKEGFSIKSPDDSFKLKLRGLLQADARLYRGSNKDLTGTTDNFLVRRARPIFEGTVGKYWDFYLMPDLANNSSSNSLLVDAYTDFKVSPEFKIRGGKFKAPFGLERLQSDAVANFIETGLPSNLVPNRDVGFQVFGDLFRDTTTYAVGIFNGGADLSSVDAADNNNDKDVIGRVFVQPFKNSETPYLTGLGAGLAGSYGHKEGSSLPTYRSPGQANVFAYNGTGTTVATASNISADGRHTRLSPQLSYYKGSFGLLGEYVSSSQRVIKNSGGIVERETFTNTSWQVSGNYVLTGELASYKGITPRTHFDWEKKTWGAWEVVGRYGQLDIDPDVFKNAYANPNSVIANEEAWGLGLNWYPHKNVRLSLDFEQTNFEGGWARGEDRPTENIIFSRLQLTY